MEQSRRPLKSRQKRWAIWAAQGAIRAGVRPNQISVLSVVFAALAGGCFLFRWYLAAALLIQLRLLCNLLDGMVAVEGGLGERSGVVFNELPDRFADVLILVPAGYAVAIPELGWSAALAAVLTACVRLLGASAGLPQDFSGPMAKPHRMAVMTVACVLAVITPRAITVALVVVVIGSAVTLVRRTLRIVKQLGDK